MSSHGAIGFAAARPHTAAEIKQQFEDCSLLAAASTAARLGKGAREPSNRHAIIDARPVREASFGIHTLSTTSATPFN